MTYQTIKRHVKALHPLAQFNVYCDRSKHGKYFTVLILDTFRTMARAEKWLTGRKEKETPLGFCQSASVRISTRRRTIRTHFAGFVVLLYREIGAGYVSHEMTHAAQFYVAAKHGNLTLSDPVTEEPLALTQGWLVNQFWIRYYEKFPEEEKYATTGRKH